MPGALDGVRILELTEFIAAPYGVMHLADMGADVIKVEPLHGDPWRFPGFAPGESRQFIAVNRGRRGIAVDLKTPQGQQVVHRLVPSVDVAIVNYRPDTPRNLGVDYDTLRALNERIVYVQNTAFGPNGPSAHRPGYDIVAQGMTGLMASDGKADDQGLPVAMNPPMVDLSTGITVTAAVCAALYARERTGLGQKVEVSLMATAVSVQGAEFMEMPDVPEPGALVEARRRILEARRAGASWQEIRELVQAARAGYVNPYYRCYQTADGVVIVACLAANLHAKFAKAVGVQNRALAQGPDAPAGPEDVRSATLEFAAMCEVRMRERSTDEWLKVFDEHGVPAGPFRLVAELREDLQVHENGLVVEVDHAVAGRLRMAGPLFAMSQTPMQVRRASPTIGQHTDEVLREAGYAEDEIRVLRDKQIVG